MAPRTTRPRPPSAENHRLQLEELQALVKQAAIDAAEARAQQQIIGPKIMEMHGALMMPQPGHDKCLLDRMAAVTISVETGDRSMRAIVRTAQLLVAVGALVSAFYAAVKWGGGTPPNH